MQPYIVPPSFEGFVSIIKNMQLIRLNVYEFDKTFNYTVILHFKIIKITPECTQVTPDHARSSPNHALGKYFLYWASPNNFSSLSSSSLLIITKQGQYHRNRSFAWCWCLVYIIFICVFKSRDCVHEYSHFLQAKGFSPVWESMWYFSPLGRLQEKLYWSPECCSTCFLISLA